MLAQHCAVLNATAANASRVCCCLQDGDSALMIASFDGCTEVAYTLLKTAKFDLKNTVRKRGAHMQRHVNHAGARCGCATCVLAQYLARTNDSSLEML